MLRLRGDSNPSSGAEEGEGGGSEGFGPLVRPECGPSCLLLAQGFSICISEP